MTETEPGKGLFIPYYILDRSLNYTYDDIQEDFGSLMFALDFKDKAPLYCYIFGPIFIAAGILLVLFYFWMLRRTAKSKRDTVNYSELIPTKEEDAN
jgi:hypothetical protein